MASLIKTLNCVQCGQNHLGANVWTCPTCGPDEGILEIRFDLDRAAKTLTRASLADRNRSHWRYRELLPLDHDPPKSLDAIGWTPLIEAPRLAKALGVRRIRLKDDGRSASGSFKDRASSVGVAHAIEQGRNVIACASTGNAASSLAGCSAAAGMQANIFVSESVPEGKLLQLLAYGARVFKVKGTYAQAYDLCSQACARFGWYNRNAAINPFLVEGKKTGGLEVAEQCADDPPDWVSCSVGDGCSIAGVGKGLSEMNAVGVIDWHTKMLGAQAADVAPIAAAYDSGSLDRTGNGGTYADSIDVPVPRNWRKAVAAVRDSKGAFVTVTDDEIAEAVRLTGRLAGVFAEPAAATAVAGIAQARRQSIIDENASVVAMITGNGLKDAAGARKAVGQPHVVRPDLDEIARIVEQDKKASQS